ncbi:MAG TPA: hypothetical protein VMF32_00440 [Xanthobacteraceae bacterium]|nr:hypothetical protein [Xanthobacteraceae bacterium]
MRRSIRIKPAITCFALSLVIGVAFGARLANAESEPAVAKQSEPTVVKQPASSVAKQPAPTVASVPTVGKDPAPTAAKEPAPTAAKDPAPTAAKDPAPTAAKDPVPTAAKDPAPTAAKDPAPTAAKEPAPTFVKQPEPTFGKQPEPTFGKQPEPTFGKQPEPTFGKQPEPTFGKQSDVAYLLARYPEGGSNLSNDIEQLLKTNPSSLSVLITASNKADFAQQQDIGKSLADLVIDYSRSDTGENKLMLKQIQIALGDAPPGVVNAFKFDGGENALWKFLLAIEIDFFKEHCVSPSHPRWEPVHFGDGDQFWQHHHCYDHW